MPAPLKLYPRIKTSETATHVFFLNGPFSQWYPTGFEQRLDAGGALTRFNCAEQYMMASKAHLMGDADTYAAILEVEQNPKDWRAAPKRHKELGRTVKGRSGGEWTATDRALWEAQASNIVFRGNWAKFTQNHEMAQFMDFGPDGDPAFGTKIIVEGAWYDKVWGVALAWDDPLITEPANWKGLNLLGKALTRVRDIRHGADAATFDEWQEFA